MAFDILPDSRMKNPLGVIRGQWGPAWNRISINYVQTYCGNCGVKGPLTPEENMTFFSYLCEPCLERLGPIVNTCIVPDQVFFQKVKEAQIEKYGRELSPAEIAGALDDATSIMSKLARERERQIK